jgi:hypothetical protein
LSLIFLLFVGLSIAEISGSSSSKERDEGYVLLEKIITTFRVMAEQGAGGVEKVDEALKQMMADAIKASTEGKIDPVFFRRYNRILMVLKLVMVEDRTGILGSLVGQEVGRFVEDVRGVRGELTGGEGIANVAEAITEEVINLHLYLENKERKKKLREEIEKKYYPDLKK